MDRRRPGNPACGWHYFWHHTQFIFAAIKFLWPSFPRKSLSPLQEVQLFAETRFAHDRATSFAPETNSSSSFQPTAAKCIALWHYSSSWCADSQFSPIQASFSYSPSSPLPASGTTSKAPPGPAPPASSRVAARTADSLLQSVVSRLQRRMFGRGRLLGRRESAAGTEDDEAAQREAGAN